MRRTQLYLSAKLYNRLIELGKKEDKTISELVRAGLEQAYMRPSTQEAIHAIHGLWADRKGFSTQKFIRQLRKDRRTYYPRGNK